MAEKGSIKLYDPRSFTATFMQPKQELDDLLKFDFGKFFVVRLEDMYRLVSRPVPPSRSSTHICIYVTEGQAEMKIGSQICQTSNDGMLFVPAGQVLSFLPGLDSKGFLCIFHDDMLISKVGMKDPLREFEFLRVWGNPVVKLDKQVSGFVRQLFDRIFLEYSRSGTEHLDLIRPYLITLLTEVNKVYRPLSASGRAAAVQLTNRFKELLFTHIRTVHQVSDYAALLHITPNHLNKTVKSITGKTPARWIGEAIVLEAKVLLGQSDLSISEVAVAVGFEDQSYFARLFRRHEGISPTAFRKMIEMS